MLIILRDVVHGAAERLLQSRHLCHEVRRRQAQTQETRWTYAYCWTGVR